MPVLGRSDPWEAFCLNIGNLIQSERRFNSLAEYAEAVNPHFERYWFIDELFEHLEAIVAGELKRLMVFMPPRHGKSESVSRIFPGYCLHRHPDKFVGLACHTAELAYTLSRNARENYVRAGHEVKHDAGAVKQWETQQGGGMWAAGVGGPITGKGFDFGIIDDPIKNAEEAASKRVRDKQWDWRGSTWDTREEPDAAQIWMMTRWNEDDLAGRELSEANEEREDWTVLSFPAISTKAMIHVPEGCTLVEDQRKEEGLALCPERYDVNVLTTKKGKAGGYYWSALYQQNPTPEEGVIWKRDWFRKLDAIPIDIKKVESDWDTAYTKDDRNSAVAYVTMGITGDQRPCVVDFDFKWLETEEQLEWISGIGGRHNVEAKATGKSLVPMLTRRNISASEVTVHGSLDKEERARMVVPFAKDGVYVYGPLMDRLLDDPLQGLLKFPNGPKNDVNDAFVQGLNRLFLSATPIAGVRNLPGF